MSTNLTTLLRLAILLLMLAALAKSDAGQVLRSRSPSFCRSQLKFAGQNLTECLFLCGRKSICNGSGLQQQKQQRAPCVMRCWHRYRLVLPLRGDAYDQEVASARCNATSDQLTCRRTCFQAAQTADLSASLTPKQRYEKVVCDFSCRQMFKDAAPLDNCKAICQLKLLVDAEAFKKFSDCMTNSCSGKTDEVLEACKQKCYANC